MPSAHASKPLHPQQEFDQLSADPMPASDWHVETQLVRGGTLRSDFGETAEAIFMNSGFVYDSAETAERRFNGEAPGFVYSRYLNPSLEMLSRRIAALEGAEACVVVASGMAAVFASMMCQLKAGDHVVASRVLFGSCHYIITELLPRYGISYTLVDGRDLDAFANAMTPETTLVFIESPANPTLELVDVQAVADIAHANGARLIVDNIFATPMLQRPFELGADIVVYSTTKHMDGQGRTLGGAVLGSAAFVDEELLPFHRHTGPALSPFNAWVVLKGLETFSLRMERHCANAKALAEWMEQQPAISRVFYPGLPSHPQHALAHTQMKSGGSMIAFEMAGGKKAAFQLINGLRMVDICNNLGDAKTLVTHPATTTHANMPQEDRERIGISEGLIRLSVGLEHIDDLIADMTQALAPVS